MSGTACHVDDDYRPPRPPQFDLRPLPRWVRPLAYLAGIAFVVIVLAQFAAGVVAEYQDMRAQRDEAEKRAKVAEAGLALVQRNGDCGVLLATIQTTDFGPAQIRVVPTNGRR